jgi:N-acetylneuraminic acid mutarotase
MRGHRRRALSAAAAAVALAAGGIQGPAYASSGSTAVGSAAPKTITTTTTPKNSAAPGANPEIQRLCPPPSKKDQATCFSVRRTDVASATGVQPNVTPVGYGPSDLASAYNLPGGGGAGATVAIVDAFDDPNAEADLAVYRTQYGLPACTTANGCFTKVDQTGGTSYPAPNAGWSGEISLDLDMVSAVAPAAHILLVEANSATFTDLGASVDEAVSLGAGYVSNSYGTGYDSTPGSGEDPSEVTALDPYYNHPGVAVVASSGDSAYGVAYPAASPYVTSVGGTSLVPDSSARGWSEAVWNNSFGGGGSGCSVYEPKPSFQTDTGCANRTVADVSAVADPATGVAVYDTFQTSGWLEFGGTSVSSPIIASVYADAGTPIAGTYPNSYPYAMPGALNDVTGGSNGTCTTAYLCTAGPGYDGPTGLGTPNGTASFQLGPHGFVKGTVTDTSGVALAGAQVAVGAKTVKTGADGSYTLEVTPGTYTVTASDFGYVASTVSGVVVADGTTVTENFSLTAQARATVSGTVTDGSGHGWPLYAAISVAGAPGGPVYTDPKTGAYTLKLPVNGSYNVQITAAYPGYQPTATTVTVGTSDITQNFAISVDGASCTAPGYVSHAHGSFQSFDTTSIPDGWTITNAANTTGGWEFDDPGNRGNQTGGSGGFAVVDSDHIGPGLHQDTTLTSPISDLSANTDPQLAFDTLYREFVNSTASVDVSIDGGATWSNVWQNTTTTVNGHVSIPLPQASGQSAVQVRFNYTGTWAWYWELDNVLIGNTTCDPVPGGLVVGQVTDANTGGALPGALVAETGAQTVTGTSAALSDPAIKGAFYWLFSPNTGAQTLTAVKGRYTTGTDSVNIAPDSAVEADFALKAGRLTIAPASVTKSLAWGGTGTSALTVSNTGTAPATVNLSELPGGFTIQGVPRSEAPVQHVTGTFPMTDMAAAVAKAGPAGGNAAPPASPAAGTAWQPIANFPTTILSNIAEYYNGRLYSGFGFTGANDVNTLYSYDPVADAWTQLASAADTRESPAHGIIGGKLYVAGGWGASGATDTNTEIYDPAGNSWSQGPAWNGALAGSASAVIGTKLYVIGGCTASACGSTAVNVLDTSTSGWSTVAAYPESTSWLACGAIAGKIYCSGGTDGSSTSAHTYVYDPVADAWSRLADIPSGAWASGYTAANGLLLVQGGVQSNGSVTNQGWAFDPTSNAWSALPNSNNAAYRFGGALGFYTVGGGQGSLPLNTASVLPGYDQAVGPDVPWLAESATSLTLAPGKSATVTLSFNAADASIVQPGAYAANLLADTDTPYHLGAVSVTMTVAPPKTWGKIAGVVQFTDSTGKLVPIPAATVQIDSWAAHYTLHTDSNGAYALWLDVRNNPLTVIAAKDGYQPQTVKAKISKGNTIIVTFTLLKG